MMPLTDQVTAGFAAPATEAVKGAVWLGASDTEGGETESETEVMLRMVTAADADCEPTTACTVTGFAAGTLAGAV